LSKPVVSAMIIPGLFYVQSKGGAGNIIVIDEKN
jgi:hypothetical protein